jgi:hypothetical protein
VWSPHLLKDIDLLENVQRRFTKRLRGMYNLSYNERLLKLNIERLEARRLRTDTITTYKIIFGLIKCTNFFKFLDNAIETRGHMYKLLKPNCKCDVRKYCFSCRAVNLWNNLPAETTNFSSIVAFKNSLNYSHFDKLCIGNSVL